MYNSRAAMSLYQPALKPEKSAKRRRKLWELESRWLCSVLGTCLSMNDLRKIQRQCNLQFETPPQDYQLHAAMVHEAKSNNRTAHCLHKILDKKYQRWIKQWSRQAERNDLNKLWKNAVHTGDIAGNFWALLTHPYTDNTLLAQANGDVHMLSHLQGAANRADIRTLEQQKQTIAELNKQLNSLRHSTQEKTQALEKQCCEQTKTIDSQKIAITQLQTALDERKHEQPTVDKDSIAVMKRLKWTEQQLAQKDLQQKSLEITVQNLTQQLLAAESQAEKQKSGNNPTHSSIGNQPSSSNKLRDKQILYVGGRMTLLPHLRNAVENHQGTLQFHDGGQEDNRASLHCYLEKADMVFCPIDCVSHDACLRVKRYCKKTEKPFIPLRSSGISSFTEELVKWA